MNINNVYIEKRVENHSNTHKILGRIKFQNIIICEKDSSNLHISGYSLIFTRQEKVKIMLIIKFIS